MLIQTRGLPLPLPFPLPLHLPRHNTATIYPAPTAPGVAGVHSICHFNVNRLLIVNNPPCLGLHAV
jgi:hypothetical protein